MKDIPVFTTAFGVASLVLKEIATQGIAYIKLHATQDPENLLSECVSFCRMAGAERIFASGHEFLEKYPFHTAIWQMHTSDLPNTDAALWPVQEDTLYNFREIYNRKVVSISNGAWMTERDAAQLLRDGGGYFVHRQSQLLGIGIVEGEVLRFVASVSLGAGADVVCALGHAVTGDCITLEVASTNEKALKLYKRLGFVCVNELSRWFQVF